MAPKRREQKKFFSYSEENLRLAIKAVSENGMSKKQAAIQFGIPRTTLVRKLLSNNPLKRKMGPKTELTGYEEDVLEKWILFMATKGFPVHKNNLILSVKKILKDSGRELKYIKNEGTPGRAWFDGFLKRHPNIKQKHAETVSKARAAVTRDKIEQWFTEILDYLKENKLDYILKDPNRIFNGDEAGFKLCPKSDKVLGPANSNEDFYERVSSEKEQLTVMATFCANGEYVPPMIVYPYKRIPKIIADSVPQNWALGRSDTGWMTSIVFYEYIGNHLIPYLKEKNVTRPIIYFVDGLKAHLTLEVSKLCEDHGIILISLFPNTTHIMQPADVAVFKPLKSGWTSSVRAWKFENFPKDMTRSTFGTVLMTVFEKYALPQSIENGFRKSGLYPFNKNNVDYSKCIPNRNIDPIVYPEDNKLQKVYNPNMTEIVLSEVEKRLDKEELDSFLTTYSRNTEWTGDIRSDNLYKLWQKLKKESEENKKEKNSENNDVNTPSTSKSCITEEKENLNPEKFPENKKSKITILSVVTIPAPENENLPKLDNSVNTSNTVWETPEKKSDLTIPASENENLPKLDHSVNTRNIVWETPEKKSDLTISASENENSPKLDNSVNTRNIVWETPEKKSDLTISASENENSPKLDNSVNTSNTVWETPEKNSDQYYEMKEKEGFKVPTPFKHILITPVTQNKEAPKRKRAIFPSVVSDRKYREYWINEQQKKEKSKTKIKKVEGVQQTEVTVVDFNKLVKVEKGKTKMKNAPATNYSDNSSDNESEVELQYEDQDLDVSEPESLIIMDGMYVIVRYEDNYYPGQVIKKDEEGGEIKSMMRTGHDWKWPTKEDVLYYFNDDIICTIQTPLQKNNRGAFSVPEMKKYME